MNTQTMRQLAAITAIVLSVAAAGAYQFILPRMTQVRENEAQARHMTGTGAQVNAAEVERVERTFKRAAHQVSQIEQYNENAADVMALYDRLSSAGRVFGLEIDQISASENTASGEDQNKTTLRITASGYFDQIIHFLTRFEDTVTFHRIRTLRLDPQGSTVDQRVRAVIEVEFFRFTLPDSLAALGEAETNRADTKQSLVAP